MVDSIIATVCLDDGRHEFDLELPAALPVQKLIPEIKEFLAQQDPPYVYGNCKISLFAGTFKLPENQTLASLGIWDGSVITIRVLT